MLASAALAYDIAGALGTGILDHFGESRKRVRKVRRGADGGAWLVQDHLGLLVEKFFVDAWQGAHGLGWLGPPFVHGMKLVAFVLSVRLGNSL